MVDASAEDEDSQSTLRFVENLKRQWLAAIDGMLDPMMIINRDFVISKTNMAAADVAGIGVKKLPGRKCFEVFADRQEPCVGCKLIGTTKTQDASTFGLVNPKNKAYYEVSSKPFLSPDGQTEGVVHLYRDRSKSKKLEDQLLQSEKLASIGLLAGGVAHELNNPLGGILIFSQMLLREMPKTSEFYEDVQEIEAAAKRCKGIVERLLDFARQNPEDSTSNKESVDLKDALQTALRFAKVSHNARLVQINENWNSSDQFEVFEEKNKLIQVFLNLLQNAYHAMPDGGELSISIQANDDQNEIEVKISDTGVGISQEALAKIFDPFFTTKDPGEGTGLGLAICYGIVTDLGGTMKVDSQVNSGTTFTVTFPKSTNQTP